MENQESKYCLIHGIQSFSEEYAPIPPESLPRKVRLAIRRRLNSNQVHKFKNETSCLLDIFLAFLGIKKRTSPSIDDPPTSDLKPGDLVRVRSQEEIKTTLDHWGRLKGCMFMSEGMSGYCGTIQRIFKPMERFLDERDYQLKKTHGIVLLQGLYCQGVLRLWPL